MAYKYFSGDIMTINDINITLKDGRKAVIRNACDEDIPGMLEYLYKSAGETDFILRYPEECSRYTPEGEKKVFADMNASSKTELYSTNTQ